MEKQFLFVGISNSNKDKQKDVSRHKFTITGLDGSRTDEYSFYTGLPNKKFTCTCCCSKRGMYVGVVKLPDFNSAHMAILCPACFIVVQRETAYEKVVGPDLLFRYGFTTDDNGRKMLEEILGEEREKSNGKFKKRLTRRVGGLM